MAASKKYARDELSIFYRVVKPGDILEFPRGWYSHFGVYVGEYNGIDHCVVHLTVSSEMDNYHLFKISASLKELEYSKQQVMQVGYLVDNMRGDTHGEIRIDSVKDVMKLGGEVFINNEMDKKWKAQKGAAEKAIKAYENREYLRPYDLRRNNCEHFVNDSRYEQHVSRQVDNTEAGLTVAGVVMGGAAILGAAYFLMGSGNEDKEKKRRC